MLDSSAIAAYLGRIGYTGSLEPNDDTLRRLHRCHMFSVPFENLDIALKRPIILEETKLFDKVVRRRRGGFCYELNGCFAGLLRALGFKVDMLSAAVAREDGGFDPPFDHMALLVHLKERWLADVGFGDSFIEPLLVDEIAAQAQESGVYMIQRDGSGLLLLLREDDGQAKPQYRFTIDPYDFKDFEAMCTYHQTSPDSIFTKKRTCTRAVPSGRLTLTGLRFITTTGMDRREREFSGADQYATILREYFGIDLSREDVQRLVSEK